MFRSLFVRMSLTYFLILMLGLLILGAFFYTFMANYITDDIFDENWNGKASLVRVCQFILRELDLTGQFAQVLPGSGINIRIR